MLWVIGVRFQLTDFNHFYESEVREPHQLNVGFFCASLGIPAGLGSEGVTLLFYKLFKSLAHME